MDINNKGAKGIKYSSIGLITYFITRTVLNAIGIGNIPAHILITGLLLFFILSVVGAINTNVDRRKMHNITLVSFFTLIFILTIVIVVIKRYYPLIYPKYEIILQILSIILVFSLGAYVTIYSLKNRNLDFNENKSGDE